MRAKSSAKTPFWFWDILLLQPLSRYFIYGYDNLESLLCVAHYCYCHLIDLSFLSTAPSTASVDLICVRHNTCQLKSNRPFKFEKVNFRAGWYAMIRTIYLLMETVIQSSRLLALLCKVLMIASQIVSRCSSFDGIMQLNKVLFNIC